MCVCVGFHALSQTSYECFCAVHLSEERERRQRKTWSRVNDETGPKKERKKEERDGEKERKRERPAED